MNSLRRFNIPFAVLCLAFSALNNPVHSFTGAQLSDADKQALDAAFAKVESEEKGPYTNN